MWRDEIRGYVGRRVVAHTASGDVIDGELERVSRRVIVLRKAAAIHERGNGAPFKAPIDGDVILERAGVWLQVPA